MNVRFCLLLSLILAGLPHTQAQEAKQAGYHIEIKIANFTDSSLILAHRFGDKFYTDDTTHMDGQGHFVFAGQEALPRGMYQVVLPDKQFFDFFLDDDQHMILKTESGNFIHANQATGHAMNQLFFNWHRAIEEHRGKPGIETVWDTTLQAAGSSLTAKFIRGLRPFQLPAHVQRDSALMANKQWQYYYYKNHFFDEIDFCESGLLRSPLLHNKINQFLTQVAPPQPDSIVRSLEQIIDRARCSDDMFRFCLHTMLNY